MNNWYSDGKADTLNYERIRTTLNLKTGFGREKVVLINEGWFAVKKDGLHFRRTASSLEIMIAESINSVTDLLETDEPWTMSVNNPNA